MAAPGRGGRGCCRAAVQGVAAPGFPTDAVDRARGRAGATPLPGQAATAHGLLASSSRRDRTVAVLRVRGPPGEAVVPAWWQHAAGGLRTGLRGRRRCCRRAGRAAAGLDSRRHEPVPCGGRGRLLARGLSHLLAVSGEKARQTGVLPGSVRSLGRPLLTGAPPRSPTGGWPSCASTCSQRASSPRSAGRRNSGSCTSRRVLTTTTWKASTDPDFIPTIRRLKPLHAADRLPAHPESRRHAGAPSRWGSR
jgi:hypothetical protein